MRLVLLRQIPEDNDLRCQWNALLERTESPEVFYTYEWALAVQRAYESTLHPLLFLAYDEEGSLCGVAALAVDPEGSLVSFLCATTADYCDFLSLPQHGPTFVDAVVGEVKRQGFKRMAFANLPEDSRTISDIRQASQKHSCLYFGRTGYVCAQISLAGLKKGKDGKPVAPGRTRIRRFVNAMSHTAPVRFEHNRSWDAVRPILPQFIRAHIARFLETGRISNFASPDRQVFLAELANLLSAAHWMVLSRMMSGDRVVAWHYGFQFRGSWFWYQPTFDGRFEKYWPGFCLLTHVIEEAAENPQLKMVDLGLGPEAYKAKFANASRKTVYVTLHSSPVKHLVTILRYRAAETVRAHPALEKLAHMLRKEFCSCRDRLRKEGGRRTLFWITKRLLRKFWVSDEVFFYEFVRNQPLGESGSAFLCPVDLDLLAKAAMQYGDDEETLAYLLRCASRLHQADCSGFALLNAEGQPVHFTWVAPFAGFHWAELNGTLPAPSPDSVLLFDSWSPASQRGRAYYGSTLGLVAVGFQRQGKRTWVFSAATNISAIRGLEKCSFLRRFSVVRQKVLWWQWLSRRNTENVVDSEELVAL